MTWEVSGIPRSWLPKVPPQSLPQVVKYLAKLGGLGPAFVPHLNAMPGGFEFDVYVLYAALRHGWQLRSLPVHFGERAHGESKWAAHTVLRWRTLARVFSYIATLRFQVNG